jgi:ribosomal protein S18 acetylase RimI-like enzyme
MMLIRRASVDDAPLLARLNTTVQQLHAEARPDIFKPPVANDELIGWFETALNDSDVRIFVGELDNETIGYMVVEIIRRPENPFTFARDFLLIDQISVNPEHQGKGFGKKLLEEAYRFTHAENLKRITLGVWNFNTHAVEFYKSQGFSVFDTRLEKHI